MAKGKFSKPRARFQEETEIEEAFMQVIGEETPPEITPAAPDVTIQDPMMDFMPEEPDNPTSPTIEKNKKIRLIALCSVAVVVLIGLVASAWYLFGGLADDGLIVNNVTVAGVNLGGMTKEEAIRALHNATDSTYTQEDMVVQLPGGSLLLTASNSGASLNVEAAVDAAYDYGRTGSLAERREAKEKAKTQQHHIALLPYLSLNTTYIRGELEAYINEFNSTYVPSGYSFDGDMPALVADQYEPTAPCQTLLLNPGTPGKHIDIEKVYNLVLDAYSFNKFEVDATEYAPEETPEPLDLEAIYQEVTLAPKDAILDMETLDITPEVYGYTFDLERAKELLAEAEYGSVIGIPMEYVEPSLLSTRFFGDVLGAYETKHTNNANRNNNLILACAALDGMILMPGEEFSYNDALGKRTTEAGYKGAPAYNGGKTVSEIGGGICQVSSTLYYCALLADLEITDRTNHSFVSNYIPYGMDATVSWGGPEFKFRNNMEYPIRIEAAVADGYVKIQIVGTDLRDYYVQMEYDIVGYIAAEVVYEDHPVDNEFGYKDGDVIETAYNGYTVKTYRCKYDKETNELISKDFEATSVYKKRDKIVARVAAPEPEPTPTPETTPDPTPTPETTPDPTPTPETTPDPTPTPETGTTGSDTSS